MKAIKPTKIKKKRALLKLDNFNNIFTKAYKALLWRGKEGQIKVVEFIIVVVPVLVNVAFFTLLERKILGLAQRRKGPNKVSMFGLLQPVADAVKLFIKEARVPLSSNFVFIYSPAVGLLLILIIWNSEPFRGRFVEPRFSIIVLLIILRLGLYPLLISGWASNRKYATIGALRGVAQTLSYEVSLAVILAVALLLGSSFRGSQLVHIGTLAPTLCLPPVLLLWLVRAVAETNRTPFDFAEGESELVSGFNIEYAGGGFALLFIAEYGIIIFFSLFTVQLFLASGNIIITVLMGILLCFFWVWIRATLPRFRYDLLIDAAWKILLPISLALFVFSFSILI